MGALFLSKALGAARVMVVVAYGEEDEAAGRVVMGGGGVVNDVIQTAAILNRLKTAVARCYSGRVRNFS